MIKLHHWEAHGACARVLITLSEKGLPFESAYIDVLARAQHEPAPGRPD